MMQNAKAFEQDITNWYTPVLGPSEGMFTGAVAWLEKYIREDRPPARNTDGPPAAWMRRQM